MPKELITVALATYNGERFLREQLDSIYAQSWPTLEVVACDDASTDGTAEILAEYARSHGLRYTINERNLGYVKNFERVLGMAGGEYIALADQDDVWASEKLARLRALIEQSGCVLAYGDAALIDADGATLNGTLRDALSLEYQRGSGHEAFYLQNCVTGCTTLFHRRLLDHALPIPSGAMVHDWWLAYVAVRVERIDYVDETLVSYRQHQHNAIGASVSRRHPLYALLSVVINPRISFRMARDLAAHLHKQAAHFDACAQLDRQLGGESSLPGKLVAWATDMQYRLYTLHHWRLFRDHPQLHVILQPRKRTRTMLKRLVSVRHLQIYFSLQVCGYAGIFSFIAYRFWSMF